MILEMLGTKTRSQASGALAGAIAVLVVILFVACNGGPTGPGGGGGGGGTTYTIPPEEPSAPRPGTTYVEGDSIPCDSKPQTSPPNDNLIAEYWLHGFRADSLELQCVFVSSHETPLVLKYKLAGTMVKLPPGDYTIVLRFLNGTLFNRGDEVARKPIPITVVPRTNAMTADALRPAEQNVQVPASTLEVFGQVPLVPEHPLPDGLRIAGE